MTTILTPRDWGSVFGDTVMATAVLDRLLHHATTVNIRGDSYRMKERRKAGLLQTLEGREKDLQKQNLNEGAN
jgi:DNA replication protein DnaC